MTEAEWVACDEPQTAIEFIARQASERKCRLLATALCRSVLPVVLPVHAHLAVHTLDTVEACADGNATAEERLIVHERVADAYVNFPIPGVVPTEMPLSDKAASIALQAAMFAASEFDDYLVSCCICTEKAWTRRWILQAGPEQVRPPYGVLMGWQLSLTRDIFGNPFRPVTVDSRWQSETAVALAAGIYAEQAFDRMPILADALEDAGCDHADILAHCRGSVPHVRGCWVVDLILGKS